jgi:hypothetical protein
MISRILFFLALVVLAAQVRPTRPDFVGMVALRHLV